MKSQAICQLVSLRQRRPTSACSQHLLHLAPFRQFIHQLVQIADLLRQGVFDLLHPIAADHPRDQVGIRVQGRSLELKNLGAESRVTSYERRLLIARNSKPNFTAHAHEEYGKWLCPIRLALSGAQAHEVHAQLSFSFSFYFAPVFAGEKVFYQFVSGLADVHLAHLTTAFHP
jgi:hypothetical protein